MANLFLIIYTAGKIGGVAGPLPYDMAECEVRRDELRIAQIKALDTKKTIEGKPLSSADVESIRSIRVECEYRSERPILGEQQ